MRPRFISGKRENYNLDFKGEPLIKWAHEGYDPTGWEIYDDGVWQGEILDYYNATSLKLCVRISPVDGSEFVACLGELPSAECADPRILMFVIATGRLFWLNIDAEIFKTTDLFEKRINELFSFPTTEYAEEWLEKNRFTGGNAYREGEYPGWDVASHPERKLTFLPPKAQELHDELWRAVIDKLVARYPDLDRSTPRSEEIFQFIDSYIKEGKHKR